METNNEGKRLTPSRAILIFAIFVATPCLVKSLISPSGGNDKICNILCVLCAAASMYVWLLYMNFIKGQKAVKKRFKASSLLCSLLFLSMGIVTAVFTLPDIVRMIQQLKVLALICIVWFIIGFLGFWGFYYFEKKHQENVTDSKQ